MTIIQKTVQEIGGRYTRLHQYRFPPHRAAPPAKRHYWPELVCRASFRLFVRPPEGRGTTAQVARKRSLSSSGSPRIEISDPQHHHCIELSTRSGTRLATGLGSTIAQPVLTADTYDSGDHTRARFLPAMTRATGRRAISWEQPRTNPQGVRIVKQQAWALCCKIAVSPRAIRCARPDTRCRPVSLSVIQPAGCLFEGRCLLIPRLQGLP